MSRDFDRRDSQGEPGGRVPASGAQQSLWLIDRMNGGSVEYHLPLFCRFAGALDVRALEASINEIVRRHEVLRSEFTHEGGRLWLVTRPYEQLELPVVRWNESDGPQDAFLERFVAELGHAPFDLGRGPLMQLRLLRLDEDDHVLLWVIHHIVTDGWSLGVMMRELEALYTAHVTGHASPLQPVSLQYADAAEHQIGMLQGDKAIKQIAYWKQKLAGAPTLLELPSSGSTAERCLQGASLPFTVAPELTEALRDLSRRNGVTLYVTLLSVFFVLLARYCRQTDLLVGMPHAGRSGLAMKQAVGLFVNTLVIRGDLSGDPTFEELLGRVKAVTREALANRDLPFEKVVEALAPERCPGRHPLIQAMFTQVPEFGPMELPGLQVTSGLLSNATSKIDVELAYRELPAGLGFRLDYAADLFDSAFIGRWVGHYQVLLEAVVRNPETPVSSLPLLTEAERHQLVVEWNATERRYPSEKCLHQWFEEQVERTPDGGAIAFAEEVLTYRELNARANRLAHRLRSLGVGPEVMVGVMMERTPLMVAGLLAILKAGGAYVSIDPAFPAERIRFMLEDAGAALVLTQESLRGTLPDAGVSALLADTEELSQWPTENPATGVQSHHLSYVIYTSGSTGRPKGVALTHRNASAFLHWCDEEFGFQPDDVLLAATTICFDLSIFELFYPLSAGAQIRLAASPLDIPEHLERGDVTYLNTVPSVLRHLLTHTAQRFRLKGINLAGEALRLELVRQAYAQLDVACIRNLYGPSEDTTYSTVARLERDLDHEPTIGRPIANTQAYVVDVQLGLVPIGVAGELLLGGHGLARGYLNRPDLSAEKFIPNPFGDGRVYRTGDLVRYRPDGNLEFLGRIDHQVKIRGFRVELGEVEVALMAHSAVRECVVSAHEDGARLVAYLVADLSVGATGGDYEVVDRRSTPRFSYRARCRSRREGSPDAIADAINLSETGIGLTNVSEPWAPGARVAISVSDLLGGEWLEGTVSWANDGAAGVAFEAPGGALQAAINRLADQQGMTVSALRRFLMSRLPEYMVPSVFVLLDALPLTPNGKVDRKALPAPTPDVLARAAKAEPPRGVLEEAVAACWRELLALPVVGRTDNFFDLGGYSLLAVRLLSRLEQVTGTALPLQAFFQAPTVAAVAHALERVSEGTLPDTRPVSLKDEARLDPALGALAPFPDVARPPRQIFLTGATGFLGAHLLAELLNQTEATVHCLVRARDSAGARARLRRRLEELKLWSETFEARIVPVLGDLALPRFGLLEAEFDRMALAMDQVIHNGAWVNHLYPYQVLKAANVGGTQEAIRLAWQGKTKSLHYISTTGVLAESEPGPEGLIREDGDLGQGEGVRGGYSQSKWVAEKLIRLAGDRGLPVTIYRPGRVWSHSRSGALNPADFVGRLLFGCLQTGKAPQWSVPLDLVPVDFVAGAIAYLSQQASSIGQTFHLTNPDSPTFDDLLDQATTAGYAIEKMPFDAWHEEVLQAAAQGEVNSLTPLAPLLADPDYLAAGSRTARYSNYNTLQALDGTNFTMPPVDGLLTSRMLATPGQ